MSAQRVVLSARQVRGHLGDIETRLNTLAGYQWEPGIPTKVALMVGAMQEALKDALAELPRKEQA